ncbi:putative transcription factor & lipid binding HD-SAD family [Helianthus annuus]|nr:putative transcription factor & lipid binding HD-SAD family [Helianthus annuus]
MHTSFSLFCFVSFCGNRFFKKNPHPTEKERTEIANKLNITMNKVKFWFQNRRTQLKSRKERSENVILKQENEQLRLENLAMAEVLKNPLCNKCGAQATIPDRSIQKHKVMIENARLKEELSHMANFASHVSQMFGIPLPNKVTIPGDPLNPIMSRSLMDYDIPIQRNEYLVQASRAMEVLLKLGNVNAPLWNRNIEGGGETLNFVEYERAFPPSLGTKPPGFVSEATRARSVVPMTSSTLVEALLNADQWREMFIGMIGSCTTMEVISNGTGGSRNGALQLVTWIEHTEYDEQSVSHQYRQLINSGVGFGAQRWISALLRHCESITAIMSPTLNHHLLQDTKEA